MSAAAPLSSDAFVASLLKFVEAEMQRLVEVEAEAAAERVRVRAREMAPRLVMTLMKEFDVSRDGTNIVIRVREAVGG